MQRAGHHVVRSAVVTALSALLLVLAGPFAGAQTHVPARAAGPGVHRTTGLHPGPAVAPQAHRSSHLVPLTEPEVVAREVLAVVDGR